MFFFLKATCAINYKLTKFQKDVLYILAYIILLLDLCGIIFRIGHINLIPWSSDLLACLIFFFEITLKQLFACFINKLCSCGIIGHKLTCFHI